MPIYLLFFCVLKSKQGRPLFNSRRISSVSSSVLKCQFDLEFLGLSESAQTLACRLLLLVGKKKHRNPSFHLRGVGTANFFGRLNLVIYISYLGCKRTRYCGRSNCERTQSSNRDFSCLRNVICSVARCAAIIAEMVLVQILPSIRVTAVHPFQHPALPHFLSAVINNSASEPRRDHHAI